MSKRLEKALRESLENLGWRFSHENDYWCLENWSPLGENLIIETNGDIETFIDEIKSTYDNFDFNEHVRFWVINSNVSGVPQSVEDLLIDAKEIEKMYEQLNDVADTFI